MTTTEHGTITIQTADAVRLITLNRPRRLNAFSREMITSLAGTLAASEADDDVRVVLLTGAPRPDGRPCFCAGADLKELAESGAAGLGEREFDLVREVSALAGGDHLGAGGIRAVLAQIETFPKPVVAVIDGVCTAGGIELALSCDLRIVSETAQISDLHVTNVFHTGGGGATSRLSRLIGPAKTKEMVFLGLVLDGTEAARIGLANAVVPPDELIDRAWAVGREIATRDPIALRMAKVIADRAPDISRDESLRYDYLCWTAQMMTTGGYAGARAFRREPRGDAAEGARSNP